MTEKQYKTVLPFYWVSEEKGLCGHATLGFAFSKDVPDYEGTWRKPTFEELYEYNEKLLNNFILEAKTYTHFAQREIKGTALYKLTKDRFITWAVDFKETLDKMGINTIQNPKVIKYITDEYCKEIDNETY